MSDRNQQPNRPENLTRREFIRDGAVTAGIAVSVGAVGCRQEQAVKAPSPVQKTCGYSSDMKYRRLGKTDLWVSSVCMGGHWKRIETVAPKALKGDNWLGASLSDADFKKNRYDVVTRCMESGINYIDACTRSEVLAYAARLCGAAATRCSWAVPGTRRRCATRTSRRPQPCSGPWRKA